MPNTVSRRTVLTAVLAALPAAGLAADNSSASGQADPVVQSRGPVRLIANENPYGPSQAARAAAIKGVEDGWQYAFSEGSALREKLATFHGVSADHIILTAGSGEALKIAALTWCQSGGRVVAARPTFSLITDYAEALGCTTDWIDLDDRMVHDLAGMEQAVGKETRLVYVCNPNNPTGTLLDPDQLDDFLTTVSRRAPIVVDEAYLDLLEKDQQRSAIRHVLTGEPVVVTRTFSKIHGMAGLRVGYAIAAPDTIRRFKDLRMTFMNRPGILAASASLGDDGFMEFSRQKIRECMAVTTGVLDELNLSYTPSHGNFVLFDTGGSVEAFKAAMLEQGILTGRDEPAYPGWARVSMGKVEEMRLFADAARRYFS